MKVPYLPLKRILSSVFPELKRAAERVIQSGQYILGSELELFEQEFASYCGTKFAIGVGSGMDALRLSIEALELPKNSEIIVPANTFVGTALAAQATGAGINTQIHYPIPIHLQTPIMLTTKKTLPVSEKFCNNVVSLPCFPYMFDKEIEYLTKIINEYKG